MTFKEQIIQGIPDTLPHPKPFDTFINHAPKRKELSLDEKKLALRNALRYFDSKHHAKLIPEFIRLDTTGEFTCTASSITKCEPVQLKNIPEK
jgi:urocanate hydratase